MHDSIDEQLVQLLETDACQTSEALARQLQVSATTVRRRIRRLSESSAIRRVALVDPSKFGFPLVAVVAVDVAHDKLESAMQALASLPETTWVSSTTGRFDILLLARFRSTEDLSRFVQRELAKIEGLRDTETFVCLEVRKGRYMQV
jgi:Lrp/AsnC family transcriptional regulator for asnA, asnC and gidA